MQALVVEDWSGQRKGVRIEAYSLGNLAHPLVWQCSSGTSSTFSLLSQCSWVASRSYHGFLRCCKFFHGSLSCVSESMLYLDGQRHFNSMDLPMTLQKDYPWSPRETALVGDQQSSETQCPGKAWAPVSVLVFILILHSKKQCIQLLDDQKSKTNRAAGWAEGERIIK